MTVSRRRFLGITGTAAAAAAVGTGIVLSGRDAEIEVTPSDPSITPSMPPVPTATPGASPVTLPAVEDRVLVVVQMSGGNDGLNTLVPVANGVYHDLRPSLALAEDAVVELAGLDEMALHPALEPLTQLWDGGQLAAMQAIGIPEQSRSHFVALDTWWKGSDEASAAGGWLGRWLDATAGADPDPMRAIAIGGGSPALTGQQSRPVIVQSLTGFDLRGPTATGQAETAFTAMGDGAGEGLLGLAQSAIPTAIDAVERLQGALSDAATEPVREAGPGANTVAAFRAAADIITADVGTRVILVNMGGFDTHANQAGQHETLLRYLADGLTTMTDALTAAGMAERALTITFSEFGRRVAENGSAGTDHGRGGLAFLAGPALAGSRIVGSVDLGDLVDGDVRQEIDARSLYANALDWLGGPSDDILGGAFDRYGLLQV